MDNADETTPHKSTAVMIAPYKQDSTTKQDAKVPAVIDEAYNTGRFHTRTNRIHSLRFYHDSRLFPTTKYVVRKHT
jgi:hypothetical protein